MVGPRECEVSGGGDEDLEVRPWRVPIGGRRIRYPSRPFFTGSDVTVFAFGKFFPLYLGGQGATVNGMAVNSCNSAFYYLVQLVQSFRLTRKFTIKMHWMNSWLFSRLQF
jgi:hypothetical protein